MAVIQNRDGDCYCQREDDLERCRYGPKGKAPAEFIADRLGSPESFDKIVEIVVAAQPHQLQTLVMEDGAIPVTGFIGPLPDCPRFTMSKGEHIKRMPSENLIPLLAPLVDASAAVL